MLNRIQKSPVRSDSAARRPDVVWAAPALPPRGNLAFRGNLGSGRLTIFLVAIMMMIGAIFSSDNLVAQPPPSDLPATESPRPERIVSMLPSLTEMLFAVGAGEQVVGVTEFCTFPPEAASRARIGGYVPSSISMENIVAMKPDLVVAGDKIQDPVIDQLRRLGFRVEQIVARDVDGVLAGLRRAGEITGHREEAQRRVAELEKTLANVALRLSDVRNERKPRVFYQVWHDPLMTAGGRSFISELIELAGGVSLFKEVDQEYFNVSFEQVVASDPTVVLGASTDGAMGDLESIAERPGWSALEAVREGRIYAMDGDLVSRPGPRLAEALELIARRLHPDLFALRKEPAGSSPASGGGS